jgi:uncharacterized protein DUF6285
MADRPTKEELVKLAKQRIAERLLPALKDPANRMRTVVAIRVLSIVEREIGKGEPRREQDWAELKEIVAPQKGAPEMVESLEKAINSYGEELAAKIKSGEVEEGPARAAALKLLRLTLLQKIRLVDPPPSPAS